MQSMRRTLKQTATRLAQAAKDARREARAAGWLTEEALEKLRVLMAVCEQDLLAVGDYSVRPRETHAALRVLRRYDPTYEARAANVAEIDRLTLICDQIMDCGLLPAPVYLCGLAEAVLQYEHVHACDADGHITSTAWDVLAQAEAGLGQSVEAAHYEQAYMRHAHVCCARDNVTPFPKDAHHEAAGTDVKTALAD